MDWHGVFPALTTPFAADGALDVRALGAHASWMLESGCRGLVPLGSLGEANTLTVAEKLTAIEACVEAAGGRAPVVAGVSAFATADGVALARGAEALGCSGLMVLPPYVYRGDARETLAHFDAVIGATPLECMLYNNPIAYGTDVTPAQLAMLAERHPNLVAVKESSADIRRVTAIHAELAARIAIFVGVDDLIVEAVDAGAVGWIAGLVNAFPHESVELFDLAEHGDREAALRLYAWFRPLLELDTVPKFVQLIKLVQAEVGRGSERVRPPRLPLADDERAATLRLIGDRLASRL
jgi:dihydrodipicolinate synthase/N-acetylneuraminate lyase